MPRALPAFCPIAERFSLMFCATFSVLFREAKITQVNTNGIAVAMSVKIKMPIPNAASPVAPEASPTTPVPIIARIVVMNVAPNPIQANMN